MPTSDHSTAAWLAHLCAEKGVRNAVISPGSRNAPLVIAFHHHPGIRCLRVIDERSAAFFALGMAQRLGEPVALVCTSGSAVLNYGPAIAEAFYHRIPLLVLTADRPEEWVDQGEGQAIRQLGVFAPHMKRSVQLPRDPGDELARWHCGRLINEAIDATLLPVAGPVHVNVPFEEPLYGLSSDDASTVRTIHQVPVRASLPDEEASRLAAEWRGKGKVLVLVGQGAWSDALRDALRAIAGQPNTVVMTEATSNLDDAAFITCIDRAIEGVENTAGEALRPELLVTFGGGVISKKIKGWLRKHRPGQHWNIDTGQRHYDTYQGLTHDIAVGPEEFVTRMARSLVGVAADAHGQRMNSGYARAWHDADTRARAIHDDFVSGAPFCDLTVFKTVLDHIPLGSEVHLANSTPVRYAQLFDRNGGHRWCCNRGTSGIDGCTSTSVGAAFASGRPTTLITGDIAFCYDANAFWNEHLSPHLKVIVIDNGGGNIFRFIPGPDSDPELLPYFETPHGRDIAKLVGSYGLPYCHAMDQATLEAGLKELYAPHDRPAVLHVTTDAIVSPKVLRDYFAVLRKP